MAKKWRFWLRWLFTHEGVRASPDAELVPSRSNFRTEVNRFGIDPPDMTGACAKFFPECCTYHQGWNDAMDAVETSLSHTAPSSARRPSYDVPIGPNSPDGPA